MALRGKEQQNLEVHYHPEQSAGVTVKLHWTRHDIDAEVTVSTAWWAELRGQALADPDGAALKLLQAAKVTLPPAERAAIAAAYGRSLKAVLAF